MRLTFTLFCFALLLHSCQTEQPALPEPEPIDIGSPGEENGEEKQDQRERYLEELHRAAPGTDWRKLESRNAMVRHRKRVSSPVQQKTIESFADGLLMGEWFERGSKFTAGSVFDVVQDPADANHLYLMSAGGSLWEMDYLSEQYYLVNHDIYFDGNYLGLVPTDENRNLIAFSEKRPMYSSDDGLSWDFATVLKGGNPVNGSDITNWFSPQVYGDLVVTTLEIDYDNYELYVSRDGGVFYEFMPYPAGYEDGGEYGVTHLHAAPETGRLFLIMKRMYTDPEVLVFEVLPGADEFEYNLISQIPVATTDYFRSRIAVAPQPDSTGMRMYIQAGDQLFKSTNDGQAWQEMPVLETTPWRQQSIYVRPSDPDFVAYGAVELYVSRDGGETFEYPNRWFDYYDDTYRYLHADIMRLTEITDPNGERQVLVSNHGGLNRLDPADSMWYSIALEGLNVAQYYDVTTNPGDPSIIYAGSQDQGFQILEDDEQNDRDILGGYQYFSGDYGHTVTAEDGNVYATAYPFGSVYMFYDVLAEDGNFQSWNRYEVEYGDEFTWIAPMMSPPRNDGRVKVFIAGGSADSSSTGSHLIELELEREESSPNYGEIKARNLPFDFVDAAAGNISAMTYSPLNTERFYVATEEGRFFRSDDEGETWEETLNFLPTGWYLYGQAIHASKTEAETVWLGGSGYSNPPVWRSTDGGENFEPVSEGLPPTVVHGLVANAAESLIFAATEAGPFVYVVSEERWFDLAGQFAPTMRYYSVEFLEDRNLARFGTYGRGAWDFQVESLVSTEGPVATTQRLKVFPNPASGVTNVEGNAAGYRLYDVTGREVRRVQSAGQPRTQVPLDGLRAGLYFLQPLDAAGRGTGLAERLVVE